MNRPDLAKSLRQDPRACDPLALCKALGIDKGSIRQPRGRTILCPAHGEKSPSCSVRIAPDDTIAARCFSCGWSADALGLIGKVLGLDFKGALEWLADYVGRSDEVAPATSCTRLTVAAPQTPPVDRDSFNAIIGALAELCPLDAQRDVAAYVHGRRVHADAVAVGVLALPPPSKQAPIVAELVRQFGRGPLEAIKLIEGERFSCADHRLGLVWRHRDQRAATLQRRVIVGSPARKYHVTSGIPFDALFGADLFDDALGFLSDVPIVVTEGAIDCLSRRKLARLTDEQVIVLGAPSATIARPEWAEFFGGRDVRVAFDADDKGDEGAQRFFDVCCANARSVERERPLANDWNTLLNDYMEGRLAV